jgi:hypothetical protein
MSTIQPFRIGDPGRQMESEEDHAAPRSVPVLFIGGLGRSGSTLLDRMLGQVPGLFSLGEVVHIWQRGLADNERCGCHERFYDCPFWSRVGQQAYGGWDKLDPYVVLDLQRAVDRHRYIPLMITPSRWQRFAESMRTYSDLLSRLYRAVQDVSGADIVVDSTKHGSYAVLLSQIGDIDLRVVHLVRNSRGVAYSWTKTVRKPESVKADQFMPRYRPATMGMRYVSYNLPFHLLKAQGVPSLFVRYESLVAEPESTLRRILEIAGRQVAPDDLWFLGEDGHSAFLGPNHTLAGNPMRFKEGQFPITADEEWRTRMPLQERVIVAALSWPMSVLYGYAWPNNVGRTAR